MQYIPLGVYHIGGFNAMHDNKILHIDYYNSIAVKEKFQTSHFSRILPMAQALLTFFETMDRRCVLARNEELNDNNKFFV